MPPNNLDSHSKRNKIILALVLLVVLVVVVSLLSLNKEAGTPSPVANQNTNVIDRQAMIRDTTAASASSFTSSERAAMVKSVSATKKSTLSDEQRAEMMKLVSSN